MPAPPREGDENRCYSGGMNACSTPPKETFSRDSPEENYGGLEHIESKHPPDKEYCDNCPRDVNYPITNCFRFAEIEHGACSPALRFGRIVILFDEFFGSLVGVHRVFVRLFGELVSGQVIPFAVGNCGSVVGVGGQVVKFYDSIL